MFGDHISYVMKTKPKRETRRDLIEPTEKKNEKKNENRTRGDRRAPDASPSSWTGCLLSFPFESCSFFYELPPRESPVFKRISRLAQIFSSSSRANNNNNNTGHASTRASFVVGSRWKVVVAGKCEKNKEKERELFACSRGGNGDSNEEGARIRIGRDEDSTRNPNQHERGLEEDKELVEQ